MKKAETHPLQKTVTNSKPPEKASKKSIRFSHPEQKTRIEITADKPKKLKKTKGSYFHKDKEEVKDKPKPSEIEMSPMPKSPNKPTSSKK